MRCPICESRNVVRRPGNFISQDQGFVCNKCGRKLRSPGQTLVYAALLLICLAASVAYVYVVVTGAEENRPYGAAKLIVVGLIVAGHSTIQLFKPRVRNDQTMDPADHT
jgi:uncharacterized paraquat-inducible protein A